MIAENTRQHSATSELRQNLITGEWVIVAASRGQRPDQFRVDDAVHHDETAQFDPFANPEESGQEEDSLIYRDNDGIWTTRVFGNKFPALTPIELDEVTVMDDGPNIGLSGIGAHEIVVTRDARRHLALLEAPAIAEVIDAFQDRYLTHMSNRAVRYVSIFHNHGMLAGASILHPHSQIMALPVVPMAVQAELDAVARYVRANNVSPFAVMLEHELQTRTRLVAENDDFVAFCPFAPRMAFEIWVMPRNPQAYFERITDAQKMSLAEVFGAALRALNYGLNNPSYNFFIHTSPCDGWDYLDYRWYISIIPRTAKIAGFELATQMEISTITPEDAAEFLRTKLQEIQT